MADSQATYVLQTKELSSWFWVGTVAKVCRNPLFVRQSVNDFFSIVEPDRANECQKLGFRLTAASRVPPPPPFTKPGT